MKIFSLIFFFLINSMISISNKKEDILKTVRKVNSYFMSKNPDPTVPTFVKKERSSNLWTRAVYYEGLMELQKIDPNPQYLNYSLTWADFHKWTPRDGVQTTNADNQCCGQTYFTLLDLVKFPNPTKQISNLLKNLDDQIASKRYDYWDWIDAIQMAMPLYAQAYIFTGDRKYIDYAMESYRWTRNVCGGGLFNTKNGFWWRDANFVPPFTEEDGNDCYWSRGNGWVYVALARVMEIIGKKDKYYFELLNDFIQMSEAIAGVQRDDGFWNVSLVSPATFGGKEATGTSLFLYGMSWGIRYGILDNNKYRKIVDKAWRALRIDSVHPDGFLGYIQGTGKAPTESQPVNYTRAPDFEDFGTGCFLLGAIEYYRLIE
jgi:rhamnogalacturonyl hydrolase YesR